MLPDILQYVKRVLLFVLVSVWGRDVAGRYFINIIITNNVNTSSTKTMLSFLFSIVRTFMFLLKDCAG